MKYNLKTHAMVPVIGIGHATVKASEVVKSGATKVKTRYTSALDDIAEDQAERAWRKGNSDVCPFCRETDPDDGDLAYGRTFGLCPYHSAKYTKDMHPEVFNSPFHQAQWEAGQAWMWDQFKGDGPYVPEEMEALIAMWKGEPVVIIGES